MRAKDEVSRLAKQLMDEISQQRRELHEKIDRMVEGTCEALDRLRGCAQSVEELLHRVEAVEKDPECQFNGLHRLVRRVELLSAHEERLVLNSYLALRSTFPLSTDDLDAGTNQEELHRHQQDTLLLPAGSQERVSLKPFRLRLNPCFVLSEIRRWDVKSDLLVDLTASSPQSNENTTENLSSTSAVRMNNADAAQQRTTQHPQPQPRSRGWRSRKDIQSVLTKDNTHAGSISTLRRIHF